MNKLFLKHYLGLLSRLKRSFGAKADTSKQKKYPCQFRDLITGKRLSEDYPICAKYTLDKKQKKVFN